MGTAPGGLELRVAAHNWTVVQVFFDMGTQWLRAGAQGMRVGLDYATLPALLQMTGRSLTPDEFSDLQWMESAALAVMHPKRD